MLDLANPLGFIADLYNDKSLQKWWKLGASCLIAAFVGFWGTLGIVGGAVMASTHSPLLSVTTGFFSACLVMAAGVLTSVQKSGVWKDLSVDLPPEFEKVLQQTDVTKI